MRKALTRSRSIAVLCGVSLTVLTLPAGASAKRIFDIAHPSLTVEMGLPGSHGYRIEIESISRRQVLLTASKDDVFAEYRVRGRVTRHRLTADFGRLGRVSVRFRRSGKPRAGGPPFGLFPCKGRDPIHESGRFVGTIRFHGEQDFTDLSAHRAKGSIVRKFKRHCRIPGERRIPEPPAAASEKPDSIAMTVLGAAARSHGRVTYLESFGGEIGASDGEPGISLVLVAAGTSEHSGRVAIERTALIEGDQGSVLASPPRVKPVTATANLPSPFAGTGSYFGEAGAPPSWSGSLAVRLPGAGPVPLTGPEFTAALCRGTDEKKLRRCLAGVRKVVGPVGPIGVFGRR